MLGRLKTLTLPSEHHAPRREALKTAAWGDAITQMRLIPDNNQIAPLLANYHNLSVAPEGITLSSDILAEIIHPPTFDSKTRILALVALPLRLAIQMPQFVEDIRDLPPDQLQLATPFAQPGSEWERGTTSLLHELADPSQPIRAEVQKWAENVKNQNRKFTRTWR